MSRRIVLVDIGSGLTLSGVLPSVALHGNYSAKLEARGGVAPYLFTTDSHLPDGLTLDAATGVLSADDVAEAGTFALVVTVTDLTGASVTRAFSLQVVPQPLTVSGKAPAWTVGTPYTYAYAATGGVPPYTWGIVSGSLPAGIDIDTATGVISGTPTAPNSPAWTVMVADSVGTFIDLRDHDTLRLLGDFAAATLGTAYSSSLLIDGGDMPYSNPIITSGALPDGLSLALEDTQLRMSGTPTTVKTYNFTVSVDSSDKQTSASVQTVNTSPASAAFDPTQTSKFVLSSNNRVATISGPVTSAPGVAISNMAVSSVPAGVAVEFFVISVGVATSCYLGVTYKSASEVGGNIFNGFGVDIRASGGICNNGCSASVSWAAGDVIGISIKNSGASRTVNFYKNGALIGSQVYAGTTSITRFFAGYDPTSNTSQFQVLVRSAIADMQYFDSYDAAAGWG